MTAADLLAEFVPIPVQRLRVDVVRYRPLNRAVLKHEVRAGWRQPHMYVNLFVRVMRPAQLPRLVVAAKLVESAGFLLPCMVGQWPEGGVVWLAEVPGETVRSLVRRGNAPHPHLILDCLLKLWSREIPAGAAGIEMAVRFRSTRRLLAHLLENRETMDVLRQVEEGLEPFTTAWAPSTAAHNDFYDDQMLLTPEGRLALVDFEEAGPGDPLLDVGVFLAHLRRSGCFGNYREECNVYRDLFRSAALERFGWESRELNLREAYALFRPSTQPLPRLSSNWLQETETGLALAAEALL